jgi:hypothetical protein
MRHRAATGQERPVTRLKCVPASRLPVQQALAACPERWWNRTRPMFAGNDMAEGVLSGILCDE